MAAQDALTMLKEDHTKVRELLKQLESTRAGKRRMTLLNKIKVEIKVHAHLEEEIFYPAMEENANNREERVMVLEAREEHNLVDKALADLEASDPDSEDFLAKSHVLRELIDHHAKEEEKDMFKKARSLLKKERLNEIGAIMAERKVELQAEYQEEVEATARAR